jgi:hypothetical protein
MDLATVLTSTVVAGLVAGLVSLRVAERRIAIENITQERAKWRDRIRLKAADAFFAIRTSDHSTIAELQSAFSLLLNPLDQEDIAIVSSIAPGDANPDQAKEFSDRVALLLKHDWERAKHEARPWFDVTKKPKRTPYPSYFDRLTTNNSLEPKPPRGSA